jgi:2-methylcitrate dehydratase PrpD
MLEDFARALTELQNAKALPADVLDLARKRVFDTVGATAVGLLTEDGVALRDLAARLAPGRPGVGDDIRLLVAATRTTEIDDINIVACTTVGSVIVPVALAAAAAYPPCEDEAFLAAVVGGYEAVVRLGTALDGARGVLSRGIWPTYVTSIHAMDPPPVPTSTMSTTGSMTGCPVAIPPM